MLSRLASRGSSTARALAVRPLAAFPSIRRDFNSSAPLSQTAVAATGETDGPVDIVKKYGAATFWGSLFAIMVSKEVFILDAEWLLSMEILAFGATGYVLTGDTIEKMSQEQDKARTDKFHEVNDFMLEMFNQYKVVQQATQNKPAVMEQYLAEYKSSVEEHAEYETVVPQHAARASVIQALNSIETREAAAAAAERQEMIDNAMNSVTAKFSGKGSEKILAEALGAAIQNLGTSPNADSPDPVKALFIDHFDGK